MSRIPFNARAVVVRQVQQALGLHADGDDRRTTWQEIANRLLIPVPVIAASDAVQFPGRDEITSRVQRALGNILVDGDDGQETWSALAEKFDPALAHGPAIVPEHSEMMRGDYPERIVNSPNRSTGKNECKGLIIHHASGYYEGTVSWCLKKGTNAGYHVLVNTDGKRTVMGADNARLYHAGESRWRGREWCNGFMLGLAFIGNTNDGAMRGSAGRDLTEDEIASAVEWIKPRWRKYHWTLADITAHRIVSPGRKDDTSLAALDQIKYALTFQ